MVRCTPGLVIGKPDQSLLEYELARIEQCHAELGRYTFAAQESFSDVSHVEPVIDRASPESPILRLPGRQGPRILDFYQGWIVASCDEGIDSDTFGETVSADVSALLSIMERVNLGKLVAESKFQELTDQFLETGGNREAMLALIVRKDREAKVIELAGRLADHYDLPRVAVESVFRFMIDTTVDIEVDYLNARIAHYGST